MEDALRFVIVFLWCVCFGFFSVMGYLDDTMTTQKVAAILAGLLAGLGVYCAIEWTTKTKGAQAVREGGNDGHPLYARLSHGMRDALPLCTHTFQRIRACLRSGNLPLHKIRAYLKSHQSKIH